METETLGAVILMISVSETSGTGSLYWSIAPSTVAVLLVELVAGWATAVKLTVTVVDAPIASVPAPVRSFQSSVPAAVASGEGTAESNCRYVASYVSWTAEQFQ